MSFISAKAKFPAYQMALVSTFFQMFIVLGMYDFDLMLNLLECHSNRVVQDSVARGP